MTIQKTIVSIREFKVEGSRILQWLTDRGYEIRPHPYQREPEDKFENDRVVWYHMILHDDTTMKSWEFHPTRLEDALMFKLIFA